MTTNGKIIIKVTIGIRHPARIKQNVEALQRISKLEGIGHIDGGALMDTIDLLKGISGAIRGRGIL